MKYIYMICFSSLAKITFSFLHFWLIERKDSRMNKGGIQVATLLCTKNSINYTSLVRSDDLKSCRELKRKRMHIELNYILY